VNAGPHRPARVSVVGCPGAGKTTFARALAAQLGVDHVEIDALHHGPGWTPAPRDVLRARLAERLAAPGWVVDGNYRSTVGDLVRPAADTVVWLDLPRATVMRSVVARTLGRMWHRTELWNGNRERWPKLLDPRPEENIVLWAWTRYGPYRRAYEAESAAAPANQRWLRFRSRADAWAWMASLRPPGGA
jgi:adenylate kinase family enzyme